MNGKEEPILPKRETLNFGFMEEKKSWQKAWKKFRRNPLSVAGLVVILLSLCLGIFAYLVVPDNSTNANRMIVEIGGKSPGFRQQFLLVPKENPGPETSFLTEIVSGKNTVVQYIPIIGYARGKNGIHYRKYIDEGVWEEQFIAAGKQGKIPQIKEETFWLGTDKYGRDILSRLLVGIRVSLSVGFIAVAISLTLGVLIGMLAGHFGGKTDEWLVWFMNVVWSIPTLLLVFAITLVLGKGFWQVFLAVGLTMWVNVARMVRGQVMAVKEMEYVEAARALGFSDLRIMFRHILPNIAGPIIVLAAANFASAIVLEAGLSFLGVGVQAPQPSWGLMIRENFNFIITNQPFLALVPGIAIMVLVLAFNLVGNGLKEAFNTRS